MREVGGFWRLTVDYHQIYSLLTPATYGIPDMRLPGVCSGKESIYNAGDTGSNSGSERSPREGNRNPFQSVFFPGKSRGQRILVGYSPWGRGRVRQDLVTKQQQYPRCSVCSRANQPRLWHLSCRYDLEKKYPSVHTFKKDQKQFTLPFTIWH